MPAIVDVIIRKSPEQVWAVIAEASSHSHWLGSDGITTFEGELAPGMKFTRRNQRSGETVTGEVVAMLPGRFLKVRTDAPQEVFAITEYHLLSVGEGCALRIAFEVYDSGEKRHGYFPEAVEGQWRANLERLKRYCDEG